MATSSRVYPVLALVALALALGGCGSFQNRFAGATLSDRECMARVMYFESNRSSEDGMLAVGTVVMNRLASPRYPKTVCGVIGQENQFADGALSKPVGTKAWPRALRVADAVLGGQRHPGVGGALFFHTAGYSFPYRNMRYVTLAGGNIFYEKRNPQPGAPAWPSSSQFASRFKAGAAPTMLASADDESARETRSSRRRRAVEAPTILASADSESAREIVVRRPREAPRATFVAAADQDDAAPVGRRRIESPRPAAAAGAPLLLHPRNAVAEAAIPPRAGPLRLASAAPEHPSGDRSRGPALAAAGAPLALHSAGDARPRPVSPVAAAMPPAKPKPIVLAMLAGKAPRSIADILAESRDAEPPSRSRR